MTVASELADAHRPVDDVRVEQVAHVHEADDVVAAAVDDRIARVRHLARPARTALNTGVSASMNSTSVRGHHHLAELPVTRGEDVLDQLALLAAEVGVRRDQARAARRR